MRTLRGMLVRSIVLALVLAGSTVRAQTGPVPTAVAAPYPAAGNTGGYPMFTPQPLGLSPALAAQGASYGPAAYPGSPYAGSPYGPMPYGPMPGMGVSPASYYNQDPQPMEVEGEAGGYVEDGGYYGDGMVDESQLGDGMVARGLQRLLPYSEGGACAPRWYDVTVDALYWTRDEVSEYVPFTAFTRFGPIVMSSDNLDYDRQPGLRAAVQLQLLPGVALDLGYTGMFSWAANTSVTSAVGDELFSPYSDFGALVGVGQPFDESDQARFHSLRASSTIDSFEISAKKSWTGPNCRLQGSYRSGVRYIYLVDDLNFYTLGRDVPIGLGVGPAGTSSTDIRTHNSLIGWQAGLDLWANIVPGISLGTDLRAGVYGNHAKYNTHVTGSTTAAGATADLRETATNNDIAVVGEANIMLVYRISPNWTLRGGYSALFLDGVALAPENFNSTNPFNNVRAVQELNDDGHVFYHGGFLGLEWMW